VIQLPQRRILAGKHEMVYASLRFETDRPQQSESAANFAAATFDSSSHDASETGAWVGLYLLYKYNINIHK
jgi:hypothetical protein